MKAERHSEGRGVGRRAMTLLEILISLTVIGILLSVVIPRVGPRRGQLRTSARNLAALIRYARTEAVYGHRNVHLLIDVKNAQYRLDLRIDSVPARRREKDEIYKVEQIRTLPDRVYFDRIVFYQEVERSRDAVVALDFSARGTVTPATIVLADAKGRHMTLDIFRTTGAVEVYKGEPVEPASDEEG